MTHGHLSLIQLQFVRKVGQNKQGYGMRWIGSNHLTTDQNVVDVEQKGTIGADVQCNLTVGVIHLIDLCILECNSLLIPNPSTLTPTPQTSNRKP